MEKGNEAIEVGGNVCPANKTPGRLKKSCFTLPTSTKSDQIRPTPGIKREFFLKAVRQPVISSDRQASQIGRLRDARLPLPINRCYFPARK